MSVVKVKCLPGSAVRVKSIKSNPNFTPTEVLNEIPHPQDAEYLSLNPLVLVLPENSAKKRWLLPSQKLSLFPAGKLFEVHHSYQTLKIQFNKTLHRIVFHIDEPLSNILPIVQQKISTLQQVPFTLVMRDLELDLEKTIREQNISTDRIFLILGPGQDKNAEFVTEEEVEDPKEAHLSPNITEGLDDILESVTPQKSSSSAAKKGASLFGKGGKEKEKEKGEEIDQKTKENSLKASNVNIRPGPKEKYKPRVAILTKDALLAFRKAGEKKAENVMKLNEYMLKESGEEEGKEKGKKEGNYNLELVLKESGNKGKGALVGSTAGLTTSDGRFRSLEIKFDSEAELKSWIAALRPFVHELESSGPVFGVGLEKAVVGGMSIPYIVRVCTEYIREHCLDVVGIFRLSGSQVQIDQLRERFDAREAVVIDPKSKPDPHTIAGLIKLYFRLLPEPILTFPLYSRFISSQSAKEWNVRIRLMRSLVESLPTHNRNLLVYLIKFLVEVNQRNAVNKMGIPNLATVFAPNLLRSEDGDMGTMVHHTPQINALVGTLIQDYEHIFNNKDLGEETAVAQYDYTPEAEGQLTLLVGDQIKVIAQGENGWWQGELKGKIGTFPGSYVKLVEKASRKAQFLEELEAEKKKLAEKTMLVESMNEARKKMEEELAVLEEEKNALEKKREEERTAILAKLNEFNVPILEKIVGLVEKAEACKREFERQNFINELKQEFDSLKKTIHNPAELRKTVKVSKDSQKLDASIDDAELKLKDETRFRQESSLRMKNLNSDLRFIANLKQ